MNDTANDDLVTSNTEESGEDSAMTVLRTRIATAWDSMSKAERNVCSFLLGSSPEHLLYASAATLGQESGTSNATVVRTFQKLGYSGFSELKRELAVPFTTSVAPEERLKRRIAHLGDNMGSKADKVWNEAEELITLTRGTLNIDEVSAAIDIIARARTTFTYGIGLSSVAALHMSMRLRRIGIGAQHLADDGFLLADQLLSMTADDALVLYVPGRLTPAIDRLVEHARAIGCPIVLLTDELSDALRPRVSVILQVPRTPTGISDENFLVLLVSDILIQGITTVAPEAALTASHALTTVRQRLGY